MMTMFSWICVLIILAIGYMSARVWIRYRNKSVVYEQAVKRAVETKKPIMVIGDPNSGILPSRIMYKIIGPPHDYGDLCIDISGCPEHTSSPTMKAKIEDVIGTFPTNSYVIFSSETLEYVACDRVAYVMEEMKRVSGGDLFVVNIRGGGMSSYTDKNGVMKLQNIITKSPPEYPIFEYTCETESYSIPHKILL